MYKTLWRLFFGPFLKVWPARDMTHSNAAPVSTSHSSMAHWQHTWRRFTGSRAVSTQNIQRNFDNYTSHNPTCRITTTKIVGNKSKGSCSQCPDEVLGKLVIGRLLESKSEIDHNIIKPCSWQECSRVRSSSYDRDLRRHVARQSPAVGRNGDPREIVRGFDYFRYALYNRLDLANCLSCSIKNIISLRLTRLILGRIEHLQSQHRNDELIKTRETRVPSLNIGSKFCWLFKILSNNSITIVSIDLDLIDQISTTFQQRPLILALPNKTSKTTFEIFHFTHIFHIHI